MTRIYTALIVVALSGSLFTACTGVVVEDNKAYRSPSDTADNDGKAVNGAYDFSNFTEVEASGASKVMLTQDSVFKVSVVGDKGVERYIEISQSGNRLIVEERSDWVDRIDMGKCEVHISLPVLKAYHLSGANSTTMTNTFRQNEGMMLDMSGAGSLKLKVEVPEITIDASGASNVNLQGKAGTLNVDMSGAGSVEAGDLEVSMANVSSSGAGSMVLWVNQHLEVDASGIGSVRYKGNPSVTKEVSGMASVKKMDE